MRKINISGENWAGSHDSLAETAETEFFKRDKTMGTKLDTTGDMLKMKGLGKKVSFGSLFVRSVLQFHSS